MLLLYNTNPQKIPRPKMIMYVCLLGKALLSSSYNLEKRDLNLRVRDSATQEHMTSTSYGIAWGTDDLPRDAV